ncbi:aldo/keto reductase [Endozoicomonadaceae bacterium StTr2]
MPGIIESNRSPAGFPLSIGPITFGGASIGGLYHAISDADAHNTLQTAWDLGIRSFDTAPEYGRGLSERRLGDFLRQKPDNSFILSSKTGEQLLPGRGGKASKFIGSLPFSKAFDFTASGIVRGLEDSLQRLGLEQLDILLLHDLDSIILGDRFEAHFQQAIDSGFDALMRLRNEGRVKAIGLGVKCHQVCEQALDYADLNCFMLQGSYTLLEQPATAFIKRCGKEQRAVFIAGPFASGILASGPVAGAYFHHQPAPAKIIEKVKRIEKVCKQYKISLPQAALHFPLRNPDVTSVVCGFHSAEQVSQVCQWLNQNIPEALWQSLYEEELICNPVL